MRGVEVIAAVQKCKKGDGKTGKPWCLYTKDGSRLLGAHKSEEDAYKQEAAIHAAMSEAAIAATLDVVAEELEDRDEEDLAIEVDRVAESIKPADALEDKIEEELNRAGFTKDVMTRIDEVADQIYRERIPHIDHIPYNQSR